MKNCGWRLPLVLSIFYALALYSQENTPAVNSSVPVVSSETDVEKKFLSILIIPSKEINGEYSLGFGDISLSGGLYYDQQNESYTGNTSAVFPISASENENKIISFYYRGKDGFSINYSGRFDIHKGMFMIIVLGEQDDAFFIPGVSGLRFSIKQYHSFEL